MIKIVPQKNPMRLTLIKNQNGRPKINLLVYALVTITTVLLVACQKKAPREPVEPHEILTFLENTITSLYQSTTSADSNSKTQQSLKNLEKLQGRVNPKILKIQEEAILERTEKQKINKTLPAEISTYATITKITNASLYKKQKLIYVEVQGKIFLNNGTESKETPIQWRCLLRIDSKPGSPEKFYLQQISEQEPGTANEDIPNGYPIISP